MISYIGLPASGKTHEANEYAKTHGFPIYNPDKQEKQLRHLLSFSMRRPMTLINLIYWTVRLHSGPKSLLKYKIFHLLRNAIIKEQVAVKVEMVFDECLLQYLCAVSDRVLERKVVVKILDSVRLNDRLVFHVQTSEETRLERLSLRPNYPREVFGSEYAERFYEALSKNTLLFKDVLSERYTMEEISN